jgi:AcrR family transcriptional regulator
MARERTYTNGQQAAGRGEDTMARKIPTTIKDQELVAQRRAEIIDVATRLFLEKGFHRTSIRDIARACPFNLASLYMYVSSKEDILFLVAQHLIDEKAKAMAAVAVIEDDPAGSFRTALQAYCRIVHRYRPHIRLLYRELDVLSPARREAVMASLSSVTDVFENILRAGISRGVFADLDPKLVALDSLFLCHLWSLHTRALRSITQNVDQFFDMQCAIIVHGVLARASASMTMKGKQTKNDLADNTAATRRAG